MVSIMSTIKRDWNGRQINGSSFEIYGGYLLIIRSAECFGSSEIGYHMLGYSVADICYAIDRGHDKIYLYF